MQVPRDPRDPRAPAVARTTLRSVLTAHGLDELVDRAELVATELATHAVCHTVGPAHLRLRWARPVLRVSVADTSPSLPAPARSPGPDAECGRGPAILALLADRWGICRLDRPVFLGTGTFVWFELLLDPRESGRAKGEVLVV